MISGRNKNNSIFTLFVYSVSAFLVMTATAFIFPLEFSSYERSDFLAPFWNLITDTGGFIGGIVIFLFLMIILILHFKMNARKYSDMNLFLMLVFLIFVFTMGFSQWYLKDCFKKPRPYQLFFIEKGLISNNGEQFFSMPRNQKSEYLQGLVKKNNESLSNVSLPVLNAWIYESGFSFPSGHAQTSFYYAVIFGFVFLNILPREKKYITFIPFIWAVLVSLSRIILGLHYPVDIAAGAFAGMLSGFVSISLPLTARVFRK